METDSFFTIESECEGSFKDRGSKFIAKVFPVETEEQVKEILTTLRKEYYDARHHCYAYRINPEDEQFRSNDDGEPSGSAGKPILNQLLSKELMNVLVVVIRYFGGTKLGVSGLINAYKTATLDAIENSKIVKRYIFRQIEVRFEYPQMNSVMRFVKEADIEVLDQNFDLNCVIKIQIKKSELEQIIFRLEEMREICFDVLINS
ncbi:MAG TPA: YigZ family protein [Bacteroidales bacterium]